uniref:Solute carrier family 15 member 1 n=1 Tax=Cyprinus carpio TaxID=7962 RepID=A0A8C2CYE5_CYPCA
MTFYFIFADEERNTKKAKNRPSCLGYPVSIFFIVVNEFCERFSYYGMKAVLVLYFKYFIGWDNDLSTTIYHTFVALCYLTPILGAIIADSWLGKFKTIVYLSIVYTIGQVIMAISAIHDITDTNRDGTPDNMTFHTAMSMLGLILIALGTGGIKPCVAAFGGDQFEEHQEKQRSTFFSIFYLSINAGSLLSTLITPILRAQECGIYSKQSCFPLAFGVPAALMVVALSYSSLCSCVHRSYSHRHSVFLPKLLIAQVKMVLKVLFLYIPLPMFWALFDQQGSRWTLQATTMDGNFIVNPILIVIMVPILDSAVYPLIKKCGLNFTPLRRMTVGMLLAALAFVAAALLQIQIDRTVPNFPSSSQTQVKFLNLENTPVPVVVEGQEPFVVPGFNVSSHNGTSNSIKQFLKENNKWVTGCLLNYGTMENKENFQILQSFVNGFRSHLNFSVKSDHLGPIAPLQVSDYFSVTHGKYVASFTIVNEEGQTCHYILQLGFGSSYTVLIPNTFTFGESCTENIKAIQDINPNDIHMAWQVIQYFLMTCGEVVFSVTGLDFSYSQAPSNMKSVLQAGWLLTVAVGNIIVLIVAEAGSLPEQWAEYVLFACLLVAVSIIFAVMAYFYTYMDPAEIEAKFMELEPDDKKRKELEMMTKDNLAYVNNETSNNTDVKQTKI